MSCHYLNMHQDWFHNEHTIVCIPKWIPKHIWGIIIQREMDQKRRFPRGNSLEQKGTNSNILVHSKSNLFWRMLRTKKVSNCNWSQVNFEVRFHEKNASTHIDRIDHHHLSFKQQASRNKLYMDKVLQQIQVSTSGIFCPGKLIVIG